MEFKKKEISVFDLKKLLENKTNEKFILIDCREKDEWDQGHINGAEHIALSDIRENEDILDKYNDYYIVVQCRSGHRSGSVCQFLENKNFPKVSNLTGGILAWIQNGYSVELT